MKDVVMVSFNNILYDINLFLFLIKERSASAEFTFTNRSQKIHNATEVNYK
jgi:hypothetical protein